MRSLSRLLAPAALILVALAFWGPPLASAQGGSVEKPEVYIDIDPTEGRKYNLAVTDLQPLTPGGAVDRNAAYLPERLARNLNFTGLFRSLDQRSFLESDPRAGLDGQSTPQYPAWSRIGADFLIKGAMAVSGSRLTLEMRLFDISLGTQTLGKRYTGNVKDAVPMINKFANEVLAAITGTPGVFGSQIVFVSGEYSEKSVMLTEFGGDGAVQVAGYRNGPSTQPTMGADGRMAWVHRNGKKWELLVNGKVVSSGDTHMSPAFKPDGTVAAAVSGPNSTAIYSFAGRNKRQLLVDNGGIDVSPTFSPDGSRMAYASNRSGLVNIYLSSANGGPGTQLTRGPDIGKATDPAWSPTGEFIAFVSRETDICIIRPDGTGFKQLTSRQGYNRRPSFSPDGRMIVFSSTRGGGERLYVMASNGDNPQPLLPEFPGNQDQPFWSPTMPAGAR